MSSTEINGNGHVSGQKIPKTNSLSKAASVTAQPMTNGSVVSGSDSIYSKLTLAESKLMLLLNKTGHDMVTPLKNNDDIEYVNEISKQLSHVDHGDNAELVFLYKVILAHSLLLGGNAHKAKETLENSSLYFEASHYEYTKIANVQANVILGSALDLLNQKQESLEVYKKAAKQKFARPKSHDLSQEESRWLHVLYHRLDAALIGEERFESSLVEILKEYLMLFEQDPSQFSSPSKTHMIKVLLKLTKGHHSTEGLKGIQNLLNSSEKQFFSRLSTPKSTDKNDVVENYMDIVMTYWQVSSKFNGHIEFVEDAEDRENTKRLSSTLTTALYLTFHSCILTRHLITVLVSLGNFKEAKAAYKTYKSYMHHIEVELEKHATVEGNVGDSRQGQLELESKMVYVYLHTDAENSTQLKQLAEDLSDLLKQPVDSNNRPESSIIAKSHLAAALAYDRCSRNSKNEQEHLIFGEKANEHYKNAIKNNSSDSDAYYYYSLALSFDNKSIEAMKYAKDGLIHNTNHLGLWHLLALLISVQEDYKVSLDILNGAIKAYMKSHDESVTMYQFETKKTLLQMAMTRVALIESLNGIDTALEVIPEVFNWFGELFPDTYTPEDVNGKEKLSSKKIRHATSSSSVQTTLLQEIWLWAASCYRRAEQFKEAEEAIGEAERIGGVNAKTHAALGFLMMEARPIHAMEEFQKSLEEDLDNLEATIGMSKLVLEHSRIGDSISKDCKAQTEDPYALFTSEKDELAAHARVSALLQQQVTSFRGRRCSEAWWLLGEIYAIFNDEEKSQQAMWNCLLLEENRAVRDYAYTEVEF